MTDQNNAAQAAEQAIKAAIRKAYDDGYNDAKMAPDNCSTYCVERAVRLDSAALLSKLRAPVAAPSDETLRLAGVIADKIEDGTLFQAGIYSRRELADRVRAVVRSVRVASAAVAGEAVAWRVTHPRCPKPRWRDTAREPAPSLDEVKQQDAYLDLELAYAAPQASEAVRDALMAFDEAMGLCDDFPELQHHRDALLFAVQKARAALSAQPGAQRTGGSE